MFIRFIAQRKPIRQENRIRNQSKTFTDHANKFQNTALFYRLLQQTAKESLRHVSLFS